MARPKTKTADSMKVNLEVTEADSLALEQQLEEEAKEVQSRNTKGKTKKQKAEDNAPDPNAFVAPSLPAVIRNTEQAIQAQDDVEIYSGESTLTNRQLQAIELLADLVTVRNVQQTAVILEVDDATIYRWLARPDFARALRLRRQAQFVELASMKLMGVYDRELNKNNPGSRILEQIGKTLGFFSDADNINLNINVDSSAGNFSQIQRDGDL